MSLNFSIEFGTSAVRDLKKLIKSNRGLAIRLSKLIDSLAADPYQGKSLKGNLKGCYSLRFTDYRVIYTSYPTQRQVLIIRIGHRKEIYR